MIVARRNRKFYLNRDDNLTNFIAICVNDEKTEKTEANIFNSRLRKTRFVSYLKLRVSLRNGEEKRISRSADAISFQTKALGERSFLAKALAQLIFKCYD